MDFMHILGQKEATWNIIFSIFERRGARENSPFPFTPLDGPDRTGPRKSIEANPSEVSVKTSHRPFYA